LAATYPRRFLQPTGGRTRTPAPEPELPHPHPAGACSIAFVPSICPAAKSTDGILSAFFLLATGEPQATWSSLQPQI